MGRGGLRTNLCRQHSESFPRKSEAAMLIPIEMIDISVVYILFASMLTKEWLCVIAKKLAMLVTCSLK